MVGQAESFSLTYHSRFTENIHVCISRTRSFNYNNSIGYSILLLEAEQELLPDDLLNIHPPISPTELCQDGDTEDPKLSTLTSQSGLCEYESITV